MKQCYYILFIFTALLLPQESKESKYDIKLLGLKVANCYQTYTDTLFNDIPSIKISYNVQTKGLMGRFFKINNVYHVILDKKNYKTLFYSKKTYQPNLENEVSTTYDANKVVYNNGMEIKSDEINIFGILYLLSNDLRNKINYFKLIDREGKKYKFEIVGNGNKFYEIKTIALNNEPGYIEHTDIFLWGLFLEKSKNRIYIDQDNRKIIKCIFKRGMVAITATAN